MEKFKNKKLSKTIPKLIKEAELDPDLMLSFLIPLYYGIENPQTTEEYKNKAVELKLVKKSGKKYIPLLNLTDDITPSNFDWVEKEYVHLFSPIGKNTNANEATRRMEYLFKDNPDLTKEEILEATKMYLRSTNAKYVRLPHYFIRKGMGRNVTEDILVWVENYREAVRNREADKDIIDETSILR